MQNKIFVISRNIVISRRVKLIISRLWIGHKNRETTLFIITNINKACFSSCSKFIKEKKEMLWKRRLGQEHDNVESLLKWTAELL